MLLVPSHLVKVLLVGWTGTPVPLLARAASAPHASAGMLHSQSIS